jgi:glycosyltransferase involved in cell wall biosynthesis
LRVEQHQIEVAILNSELAIGYVSTYPPRACGIATYTRDLSRALLIRGHARHNVIVAIEDEPHSSLNSSGRQIIQQHDRRSYIAAAGFLNESNVDVVSLQHEFGIYGGEWGEYVLELYRNIVAPLVTTFHTVMSHPVEKAIEIVREISGLSESVVVTVESAAKLLERKYGIESQKIEVIHHGASVPDRMRRGYARRHLNLRNRTVLITTGLISSGKGIEYAIRSLPYLVQDRPNILYLVAGETHPEVRKRDGEAYRTKLIELTRQLKVERNVRFVNRYLPDDELSLYLQAADIYIAPYLGRDQVSSGTITLALTHGKAVVSTPTVFAKEVLSEDRGLLCKFADGRSVADRVQQIFSEPLLKRRLEANAFKYGQEVGWSKVADEYADVFRSARQAGRALTETTQLSEA